MRIDLDSLDITLDDYKTILENCYDEIMVVNAKGIVVYINDASKRNYGLSPFEIIGKSVRDLYSQGYYAPLIAPLVMEEKKTVTLEQETNQGEKLVVTVKPIFNQEGKIKFIVANSRNISEIESLKYNLEKTKCMMHKFQTEAKELRKKYSFYDSMIVSSETMKCCLERAQKVATSDVTLLILGESGTGKNVMAKHIHEMSGRSGPFLAINCTTIPPHLLESELFGYCRGAFTGASSDKPGLLELANNGTILMDEISEIPLPLQAKILEFIQEKQFMPIGGRVHKKVNSRILAATNRDLTQLVEKGEFREDLYYRLNIVDLHIPPLRDRRSDIQMFIYYFLERFNKEHQKYCTISKSCMEMLNQYHWPGNVRELEHLIERLVLITQEEEIKTYDLPDYIYQANIHASDQGMVDLDSALENFTRNLVVDTYQQHKSSYKLAKALKITQPRAHRLICKYISKTH